MRTPVRIAALVLIAGAAGAVRLPGQSTVLRCGTLIDAISEAPRSDIAVEIVGDRIGSVVPFREAETGDARVIDLSDRTCLPGLIDAHAHILIETDDYQVDHMRPSAPASMSWSGPIMWASRSDRGCASSRDSWRRA